jgi:uncharacterized membrane protein
MKKITFHLLIAMVAIFEVLLFAWAIARGTPFPFVAGLILGIAILFIARMDIEDIGEDERTQKIREKTALTTLQISWIALLAFSSWMIIEGAGSRGNPELRRLGIFGIGLLLVNAGMIAVFILLSFYYRKQFGE